MIDILKPFAIDLIKSLILILIKALVCYMVWNNTYEALNSHSIGFLTWANIIIIIDTLFNPTLRTQNEKIN